MDKRIRDVIWHTWQAIGHDILEAYTYGDEEPDNEAIAESILEYVEIHGREKEAAAELRKLDYAEKKKIAMERNYV